jgi:RimJ/RimL family protein N-acetyltransferase
MELRRLTAADAEAYRRVRLEGLREAPLAFVADFEKNSARPLEYFAGLLKDLPDNFVIGAFDDGALIGVGGLMCDEAPKLRHKGLIWGVYVVAGYRGRSVGRRILEELIANAAGAPHIEQINIISTAVNARARDLYLSLGFKTWGLEPRSLLIDGQYYDDEHMVLLLTRDAPSR